MKQILNILFAIVIIGIGSNLNAFAPTEISEGKQVFLVRHSQSLTEYRKDSVETEETEVSKTNRENEFDVEDIQGQGISDEAILVVTFLVFAVFFFIIHFGDSRLKML